MVDFQKCPICGCEVHGIPRYPRYLCPDCASETTSEEGRRLTFSNDDLTGGYKAWYVDSREPYQSHTCFVRGHRCWADEARFGGIVIETLRPGEERP